MVGPCSLGTLTVGLDRHACVGLATAVTSLRPVETVHEGGRNVLIDARLGMAERTEGLGTSCGNMRRASLRRDTAWRQGRTFPTFGMPSTKGATYGNLIGFATGLWTLPALPIPLRFLGLSHSERLRLGAIHLVLSKVQCLSKSIAARFFNCERNIRSHYVDDVPHMTVQDLLGRAVRLQLSGYTF